VAVAKASEDRRQGTKDQSNDEIADSLRNVLKHGADERMRGGKARLEVRGVTSYALTVN